MKTVIMAGGRGTRISALAPDIPKPMIPIGGRPVLEHEILCLREQGFREIILTVSHMADAIIGHFGDGSRLGVRIAYYREETPLGNAGALLKMREQLTEDFLLLNADAVFDIDFNRFVKAHREKGGWVTLFTHPNNHPYDSGILTADERGAVLQWLAKEDPRPQWYRNRANAGLHVISPAALDAAGIDPEAVGTERDGKILKVDLDRQILKPLCGTGRMFCYDSPEYVRDMGTPERYRAVCEDFRTGRVQAKNLRRKQKAVFLDRDGTINRYKGFLRDIGDFELLPGAAEGIRRINEAGYLAVVVTNQPVIARGEVTEAQLREIHNKMETLLGAEGAYLDAIYHCPHHPHGGYPGERPELKIDCACRKPKPGMILQAAADLNIDIGASWMVGDDERDIRTGKAAGCRTALISENGSDQNDCGQNDFGQDITVRSLAEFTDRAGLAPANENR